MKNKLTLLLILIVVIFASCSTNSNNSTSNSIVSNSSVSQEGNLSSNSIFASNINSSNQQVNDFTHPTTSSFSDYVDYGKTEIENYNGNKWFYNQLNIPLADPFVYEENGTFYIYGSTDRSICSTVDCYTTQNFSTYEHHQNVYVPQDNTWEKQGENNALIFAPELFKYNGYYYLTYSNKAKADNVRYISIAKSTSPLGPFLQ